MSRLVQDGKSTQKLYTRYAIKDRIPLEMESTIQPVVMLDDLRDQSPDTFLTKRASFYALQGGVVANFSTITLLNPAGSGRLLLVIAMNPIGNGQCLIEISGGASAPAGNATTEKFWNSRFGFFPGLPVGQGRVGTVGSSILGIANQCNSNVGVNGGRWIDMSGIILDENVCLTTQCSLSNTGFENTIVWDEVDKTIVPGLP